VAPDPGVLGLIDDQVVFVGISSANFEIRIPLANVRWLGQASVAVQQQNAVSLHCELESRWQLYNFGLDDWQSLVNGLKEAGIPVATYQDRGPMDALRLRQNVYGQWERDHTVQLYLAPDRLLADWHTAIMLDCIQGLTVLSAAGLNLTRSALLEIKYSVPDAWPQVMGFAMSEPEARGWAEALRQRTKAPLDYGAGRKKKES
jgi:hypothetical protein